MPSIGPSAASPRWHPRGAGRSRRVDTPANPARGRPWASAAGLAWLSAHAKTGCGAPFCRISHRTRWQGWALAANRHGNGADFPGFDSPRHRACGNEHVAPVLLRISNAVFWVVCQFDKPNGSARSLGPSSIPSLGDGVMLGTAWIDRPVDTRGCTPLPRPFVQHGSAAMPVPSATGNQASALAP
jgi:hypothetical protein